MPLSTVRHKQGRLLGKLEGLGFRQREDATLETLTQDVVKSSEIEGEKLPDDQVRSSIARRLGIEIAGEVAPNRNVEGVVEMMLNATQRYDEPLTDERLFGWHASLFPTGRSGMFKIQVGGWRDDAKGPMQVVSGAIGRVAMPITTASGLGQTSNAEFFIFRPSFAAQIIRAAVDTHSSYSRGIFATVLKANAVAEIQHTIIRQEI